MGEPCGRMRSGGINKRTATRAAASAAALALAVLTLGLSTWANGARADNRQVPPLPDWQSKDLRDHPLAGRIWSRRASAFVTPQDYGTQLAKARLILLGEVHDNADHHRLQAWAIRTISKLRGARLVEGAPQMDVVAMEMLTADEQKALDRFYSRNARVPRSRTADDFGRLMKWDKLGWPDYAIYKPIIEEAISAYIAITPASPSRAENRKVSKEGLGALPEGEAKRLSLDTPLPPTVEKDLADEIRESHCGMLPDAAVPAMSLVQRLRDARMADAMLVSEWKGAALIAGNGHVRRDRGVPWYLQRRGVPADAIAVVRHVEVEAGATEPRDYELGSDGEADALADFVVFTPRQPRPEPCEEMRRQMEAIKAKRKQTDSVADPKPPADSAPGDTSSGGGPPGSGPKPDSAGAGGATTPKR